MSELRDNNRTLYAALKSVASRQPDAVALVYHEQPITYADLVDRIENTAAHLHSLGLRRGQAFAVFGQNRPEFIYGLFTAAKLGFALVPVNSNLTPPEVGYLLEHSDSRFVFHDDKVVDLGNLRLPEAMRRPISELGNLATVPPIDDSRDVAVTDDVLITYTSGSTATPKAVVHDHASQLAVAESLARFWDLGAFDTTVVAAPFGFLLGLSTITAASLLVGARVIVHEKFRPQDVLEDLMRYRATIYNGVPTMFQMMLEFAEQHGKSYDLSHMRALISSGAPLPEELQRRFARTFGKELQNYFGMTESYPLFGRYTSDAYTYPAGAAGRIAPGAVIRVFGASGKECAQGETGELFVRGPATIKRYHKNPELTASSFQDGLFRSGDLGYVDKDGYVYLTGRAKDIIKRGGANVAPAEVESVLLQHPMVQAVAVIGVPDAVFNELPVAYVVLKAAGRVSSDGLMEFAAGRLAKYKVPAHVRFLPELPLGVTGKVDKKRLLAVWSGD